jgi:predicted  nucleic acid-binding Zn-ribbon protein
LNTADLHGVALAAIQGLNQQVEEQRAELLRRQGEIADLKQSVQELQKLVQTMNQQLNRNAQ